MNLMTQLSLRRILCRQQIQLQKQCHAQTVNSVAMVFMSMAPKVTSRWWAIMSTNMTTNPPRARMIHSTPQTSWMTSTVLVTRMRRLTMMTQLYHQRERQQGLTRPVCCFLESLSCRLSSIHLFFSNASSCQRTATSSPGNTSTDIVDEEDIQLIVYVNVLDKGEEKLMVYVGLA